MPTGKHFDVRVFDDIVTAASVGSPEMIHKTGEALALADNLGVIGGAVRYIGTPYHFNDAYSDIIKRKIAVPRIYPATLDGTDNFEPDNCALISSEVLAEKRRTQGPYVFTCQMLLQPKGDTSQGFRREWLVYSDAPPRRDGIVVDAAKSKKKKSDWTAMWVIGAGQDEHFLVLDVLRDKLNLGERTEALFGLVAKWKPLTVGFEQYGLMGDIEHIRHVQAERNFRFRVQALGGSMSKEDRIKRLMPYFEQGRIVLLRSKMRTLFARTTTDLIDDFVEEEYMAFPVGQHDDMLDGICDAELQVRFPWDGPTKSRPKSSRRAH